MNNYILLNGKKYKASQFAEVFTKSVTARVTRKGAVDVTYGPVRGRKWQGILEAPNTIPDSSWGTPADLRTAVRLTTSMSMDDHYGTSHTVKILGEPVEMSRHYKRDNPDGIYYVKLEIVKL